MIIYKCKISDDEMFSDIYKIKETHNGLFLEVEGKTISRTEGGIDDSLIGGNASAEEVQESTNDSTMVSGVDIVLNHHLQEIPFDKKAYQTYIKEYMKAIKASLEKEDAGKVDTFMEAAKTGVKTILGNFKNYQFFTGESMNTEGAVGLLDYREDGITPFMIFFKDGLIIEKC